MKFDTAEVIHPGKQEATQIDINLHNRSKVLLVIGRRRDKVRKTVVGAEPAQKPHCASFDTTSLQKWSHFELFLLLRQLASNCFNSFVDFQIMKLQGMTIISVVTHHSM